MPRSKAPFVRAPARNGAPPPPKRETAWLIKLAFLYDGKPVRGARNLARLADLPENTVYHHVRRLPPGSEVKPILDEAKASRSGIEADPNVGEDGLSLAVVYGNERFGSKKLLAEAIQNEHGIGRKTVERHLARIAAGSDVTALVDALVSRSRKERAVRTADPGRSFVYGAERLDGVARLAAAANMPERMVADLVADIEDGADARRVLDQAALSFAPGGKGTPRSAAKSYPVRYRGDDHASKLFLAIHLGRTHGISWRAIQKQVVGASAGEDVTAKLDVWLKDALRIKRVNEFYERTGINKTTLTGWIEKGLDPDLEVARWQDARQHRQPATRRDNTDWSRTTPEAAFATWPEEVHMHLANLDLSEARVLPYREGEASRRVGGLICRTHGKLSAEPAMSKLKRGQQPCQRCWKSRAKGGTRQLRTVEHLRLIVTEKKWPLWTDGVSLLSAQVVGRRGTETYIRGLVCSACDGPIADTAYSSVAKRGAPCRACAARTRQEDAERRVLGVHAGRVVLEKWGGSLGARSGFRCTRCRHSWATSTNAVIGTKSLTPTGCRECARGGIAEAAVGHFLTDAGAVFVTQYPVQPRDDARALLCDFFLPRLRIPGHGVGGVVIEVDGRQHYEEVRFTGNNPARALRAIRQRDDAKVEALRRQGVPVCRIPHWCDARIELALILAGKPTYVGTPFDAERVRDRTAGAGPGVIEKAKRLG